MSASTCDACHEQPVVDKFACTGCERRTINRLTGICGPGGLSSELRIAVSRQTVLQEPSEGSRSAGKPLPYAEAASQATSALRAVLVSWTRLVMEERPSATFEPPHNTLSGLASWLAGWTGTLAGHPAAGDYVSEVQQAVDTGWKVVDIPAERTRVRLDHRCPEQIEGEAQRCAGQLVIIRPRFDTDTDRIRVVCVRCEHVWPAVEWRSLGRELGLAEAA